MYARWQRHAVRYGPFTARQRSSKTPHHAAHYQRASPCLNARRRALRHATRVNDVRHDTARCGDGNDQSWSPVYRTPWNDTSWVTFAYCTPGNFRRRIMPHVNVHWRAACEWAFTRWKHHKLLMSLFSNSALVWWWVIIITLCDFCCCVALLHFAVSMCIDCFTCMIITERVAQINFGC